MKPSPRVLKNKFIVLEGLSGSGKTTVAKLLAKKLHAASFKTPSGSFAAVREIIDNTSLSPSARAFFYLGGILDSSEAIKTLLKKRTVVCDRYFLTTYCYHKAIGADFSLASADFIKKIKKPDITFLITCEEHERRRRLGIRGMSHNDKQEIKLHSDRKFLREYRKFSPVEIDNTTRDVHHAVEKIISILSNNFSQ
ncbi:MAG: AAA family ATPase [Candidatus Paceibacterota bacterium]|jgi:dTMP kinase